MSIDFISDWLLGKRREDLKLNMHFYLMIIIYGKSMVKNAIYTYYAQNSIYAYYV